MPTLAYQMGVRGLEMRAEIRGGRRRQAARGLSGKGDRPTAEEASISSIANAKFTFEDGPSCPEMMLQCDP